MRRSERRAGGRTLRTMKTIGLAFHLLALALILGNCASVKPYEREYLADPITDFAAKAEESGVERHFVETIEGGSGGDGGAGGGCACN